jgi:hypothetical protein
MDRIPSRLSVLTNRGGIRHGADLSGDLIIQPNEARLFCNRIRSYITYLMAEDERLTRRQASPHEL